MNISSYCFFYCVILCLVSIPSLIQNRVQSTFSLDSDEKCCSLQRGGGKAYKHVLIYILIMHSTKLISHSIIMAGALASVRAAPTASCRSFMHFYIVVHNQNSSLSGIKYGP